MNRDHRLDVIKGIACIMMIFPHTVDGSGLLIKYLRYIGGFAPIIFFAVSGIILNKQLQKKSIKDITLFYTLFFFFGFSLNTIRGILWSSDIIQIISMSNIILAIISKYISLEKISVLFPVPFLIHLLDNYIPNFPLRQFIITPGEFSLFPWLSFFLFGIFIYSIRHKGILVINLIFLFLLSILFGSDYMNKWDMSIGYFLLGCLIFTSMIHLGGNNKYLIFLGVNSLLFFFVHLFIPTFLKVINPIIFLIIDIPLIFLLMHVLISLKGIFEHKHTNIMWLLYIILFIVSVYMPKVIYLKYILGFYLALNYYQLHKLYKIRFKENSKLTPQQISLTVNTN